MSCTQAPFVVTRNKAGVPYAVLSTWIDENKHMNVNDYIAVFDECGFGAFFDSIGIGTAYMTEYGRQGYTSMTLQSNVKYIKEIREGATFEVRCQLLDWSERCVCSEPRLTCVGSITVLPVAA